MPAKKPVKAPPKKAAAAKPKAAARAKPAPAHAAKPAHAKPAASHKPAAVAGKSKPAAPAQPAASVTAKPAAAPTAKAHPKWSAGPEEKPSVVKLSVKPAVSRPNTVPRSHDEPLPKTQPLSSDAEAEEGDGYDPLGLLSGPRDVKPYIPKRGEQYMSAEQLDHFRTILNTWKRDLMEEVDRTVLHMKDEAANFPDPNDRATQESEFSLELRTRDRERKLIRKIDEALARIDDGTYGYCLETGEEIGIKRLEARPVATLSVEAQERRERREKQYGDREDRYR